MIRRSASVATPSSPEMNRRSAPARVLEPIALAPISLGPIALGPIAPEPIALGPIGIYILQNNTSQRGKIYRNS